MACAKYFLSENKPVIPEALLKLAVRTALKEDIGSGDITTRLSIPKQAVIRANIVARESFLICGMELARESFRAVDPRLKFVSRAKDGQRAVKGAVLAAISGKAAGILTAERVALNFISFLSGVATKTSLFAAKISPYKTKITDTRKTIPGLRILQKYAVRVGSGYNHRMSLDEMVLIKDNHLKIVGGHAKLPGIPKGCKLEIESQNLKEFVHAMSFRPDVVMLDNMSLADIRKAVKIRDRIKMIGIAPAVLLEASGGINLSNVRKYAATGVDLISIGELTDSVTAADVSLDVL